MIRICADQLTLQRQELLRPCYLLCGNDPFLLQESQDYIRGKFDEHFSVTIDIGTDWNTIFNFCKMRCMFTNRQTLLLVLPDHGIPAPIGEKLLQLWSMLHKDLLLILRFSKLTRALANSTWFKALRPKSVLVNCVTPEKQQLLQWLTRRTKSMNFILDNNACKMLCYCYEGNLLALTQALERLSLLYPDGNLTLRRVAVAINDTAYFTYVHWIDASLAGKSKRAIRILRQLHFKAMEPVILLRNMQREVLQLLTFKRQMATVPICMLFDRYQVWQNRRPLLTQALGRLTVTRLRDAVALMTKIELALKHDYNYNYLVWPDLSALVLILCGNTLPSVIVDN